MMRRPGLSRSAAARTLNRLIEVDSAETPPPGPAPPRARLGDRPQRFAVEEDGARRQGEGGAERAERVLRIERQALGAARPAHAAPPRANRSASRAVGPRAPAS